MVKKLSITAIGLLWLLFAVGAFAKAPSGSQSKRSFNLNKVSAGTEVQTASNIANWMYWVRDDGKSGYEPFVGNGSVYPRGKANVIFQDGIVWGGWVNNDTRAGNAGFPKLRVGGQTYRIGTTPGWITTPGTPNANPVAIDPGNSRVQIYRIRRDYASLKIGDATVIRDASELNGVDISAVTTDMQQAILDHYAQDWANWPGDLGAPFVDVNQNGTWDPGTDEPGIADADQVIWFVTNDVNSNNSAELAGSPSIGLEMQTTIWAYNQPSATLGQMIFKQYRFINKSGVQVDSMFIAQWSDPDVGTYTDDLAGNDKGRSLGFAYSGFLTDDEFQSVGSNPAAGGYDFFQGPLVQTGDANDVAIWNLKKRTGAVNLPMTSFGFFAAGSAISDPQLGVYDGTLEWYNLLNGFIPTTDIANPSPYITGAGPNAGQPTKFPLDGDPFRLTGDIDAFGTNLPPGDRRIVLASGPFTLADGDSQEVTVAVVGGVIEQQGGTNRNAVEQMKLNDDFAQFIFNNLFQGIPKPPVAPKVNATPLRDEIVLEWGSDAAAVAATEAPDPILGFNFEGYNVYQFPGKAAGVGEAKKIATFDVNNFITIIRAKKFVPEFGDIVEVPIQNGKDTGIKRSFVITKDFINDRPLRMGTPYFFAVTGYNFNPDPTVPEPSLESALNKIEVIPQDPKPGVRYPDRPGKEITVTKIGSSTGSAQAFVVDPSKLTGHDYKIGFHSETLGNGWHRWYMVDVTTGDTLLKQQENLAGDNNYPIVDGILPVVIGPKNPGFAGWNYTGDRWISGVNWGGAGLFGGLDIGANFFGSTLTESDLVPIQLTFQGDTTSGPADGWASRGAEYRRDLGYPKGGTGYLPFSAWDVSDAANPRQVNVSFVEDINEGNANLRWDMGGWDGTNWTGNIALGGREYIFIHKSDYDEGAEYDSDANWAPAADVLYAIWPKNRGSRGYLKAPFTLNILANLPNTSADSYTFSTNSITISSNLAKADVKKVNVFPNPYYASNSLELNRFNRFVTFTHLPRKAEIRIFNLAGIQVRKLDKNDDSQFFKWDLKNERNLPVASGMYIARINMPDQGVTKILKMMIVQGEQILEFF